MRLSTIASIATINTAAATAAAYAAGSLGFTIGTDRRDGRCKLQSDYEADFTTISAQTSAKIVRVWAASTCSCAERILPAAKLMGFQVMLGIWYVVISLS